MDGKINKNKWMDGKINEKMNGWMERLMKRFIDGWKE